MGLIVALLVVLSFFPVTGLDRSGGQFDDIATNFDASPHSIYRRDAQSNLTMGVFIAFQACLSFWLIAGVVLGLIFEPPTGVRIGLLVGLGAGLFGAALVELRA